MDKILKNREALDRAINTVETLSMKNKLMTEKYILEKIMDSYKMRTKLDLTFFKAADLYTLISLIEDHIDKDFVLLIDYSDENSTVTIYHGDLKLVLTGLHSYMIDNIRELSDADNGLELLKDIIFGNINNMMEIKL